VIEALLLVAARSDKPLSEPRYNQQRETAHREARDRGELVSLPSVDTICHFFGSWGAALEAAGLPRVTSWLPPFTGATPPRYTIEEKVEWLRTAWVELGAPFTSTAYNAWRQARVVRGLDSGPSLSTVVHTFGSWPAAAAQAHPLNGLSKRRRVDE
jgi:hypothetical protein